MLFVYESLIQKFQFYILLPADLLDCQVISIYSCNQCNIELNIQLMAMARSYIIPKASLHFSVSLLLTGLQGFNKASHRPNLSAQCTQAALLPAHVACRARVASYCACLQPAKHEHISVPLPFFPTCTYPCATLSCRSAHFPRTVPKSACPLLRSPLTGPRLTTDPLRRKAWNQVRETARQRL
jgi:hypothetical protein